MRKFLLVSLLMGVTSAAYAMDRTAVLGLSYGVGPSFIAGGEGARNAGSVQPGVDAAIQFGLHPSLDFLFSYDYIHANLRSQALTFGGQYRVWPDRDYSPIAGAGLGFGKPYSGEGWDHFSLKLFGGLERSVTNDISLAGLFTYQYIDGSEPIGSIHSIEPGVRLVYYFGNLRR